MSESPLVKRVLAVVAVIPPGNVTSYGEVAKVAGCGARNVGTVLKRHGGGATTAWWRVVRADGASHDPVRAAMIWFLLFLATAIEVTGTLCLRMSAVTGRRFWVALVALCYVSAYGFLALVLKAGMDLGVAYGIWAATGVALTAIASYLLFKEPFTWLKSLGVVLIVGGVLLVEAGA